MSATNQEIISDKEDVQVKTSEIQEATSNVKEDANTENITSVPVMRNAIIAPPNVPVCPPGMIMGSDGVCRDPF
ncbi:unnamed protein product [Danaus chrysippus]|uniref:(African queen) hypothetical protein n=1 Tax=Danaus chrysippus TaxID=151541 RepID=A0A8J2WF97_9NEOP|nr:unnamed protein product [Danaus chrysippus]